MSNLRKPKIDKGKDKVSGWKVPQSADEFGEKEEKTIDDSSVDEDVNIQLDKCVWC